MSRRHLVAAALAVAPPLLLSSCASVQEMVRGAGLMPTVEMEGVGLDRFSFDSVDMRFDLAIDNPNAVGIELARLDWGLAFDGKPFVGGKKRSPTRIDARGTSTLPIPVSVSFAELYETVSSLSGADELPYRFHGSLGFDVPVLGRVDVPISHSAALPALRTPSVRVGALELSSLSLTGAELDLRLDIDNPNSFGLALNALRYDLSLAGARVASGETREEASFAGGDKGSLRIPVAIDFLSAGRTLFAALGGRSIDCRIGGTLDLGTTLPEIAALSFPFGTDGEVPIVR